jgi:hypothetical protein
MPKRLYRQPVKFAACGVFAYIGSCGIYGFKAAFAAEFFQAEKCSEEDVLRNIFDLAGPTEQSIGQSCNIGRISLDNTVKCRFVTPIELFDETLVINRIGHDLLY